MSIFYLILLILSTVAVAADVFLRYVEKIANFGIEGKGVDGELFGFTAKWSKTIPVGKLLPESFTMLLLAVMAMSGSGSLLTLGRLPWFASLPCSVATGLLLCFVVQYHAANAAKVLRGDRLPKGEKAAGLDGYCTLEFVDGYGKVKLFHKDREFEVQAGIPTDSGAEMSEIALYDKVVALYESGEIYFVVKPPDVFAGIDTKF
jgi:hypothetical protein